MKERYSVPILLLKQTSRVKRVPFRSNRDFSMMLYVLHRAVLFGEIKCRRAEIQDRSAVQELLAAIPTKHKTLSDFDLAMDPLQPDLSCFVFECNDLMLGLAILRLLYIIKYICLYIIIL